MNPKFIDYDFPSDSNYVQGYFGKQPELETLCANYEDVAPVYTDEQIKEKIANKSRQGGAARLVTRIFNQKQEGSCVGNGSCQAFELAQARQFGKDRVVPISPMSLYKRIGQSAQSGAVVSDAWKEMSAHGVLPLDTPENKKRFKHTHPATGFSVPLPAGWQEKGAMFKGLEATIIRGVQPLKSALSDEWPVVVGRAGHCICYVDILFQSRWLIPYVNSWGEWGDKYAHWDYGFGFDTDKLFVSASDWAFAIRSITVPSFQLAV